MSKSDALEFRLTALAAIVGLVLIPPVAFCQQGAPAAKEQTPVSIVGRWRSSLTIQQPTPQNEVTDWDFKADGSFSFVGVEGTGKASSGTGTYRLLGGNRIEIDVTGRVMVHEFKVAGDNMSWHYPGGMVMNFQRLVSASSAMTNEDVIKLVQAKLGDPVIIAKIKSSQCRFDTSTDSLIKLKEAGVSDAVIQAMSEAGTKQEGTRLEPNATGAVAEPEFVGIVYRLGVGGELQALERKTPVSRTKVRFMGYGGAKGTMELAGGRSSVRIKSGEPMEFVVRGYAPHMDPSGFVQLYALKPGKNKREVQVASVGALGMSTKYDPTAGTLPVNATQYGAASIKVVPAAPLPPGEYALRSAGLDMFCFGVDPDNKE